MPLRHSLNRLLILLSLMVGLAGCSSPPPAPVDSRAPPPSERINHHIVSSGETLFAIAWRYEKDIHKLASANGIPSPYTIYSDQRLTLDTSRAAPVKSRSVNTRTAARTKVATTRPKSAAKPVTVRTSPKPTAVTRKPTPKLAGSWSWQWPVEGKVSRIFSSGSLFKGINIQSYPGKPVKAAAPGMVVYAGNGLRGYGQLIIIKHSDVYLSAYAHNRKMFVKEGSVIVVGQKISEVGGDPADSKRLYFEIRKDGKPVNPLHYLPRR